MASFPLCLGRHNGEVTPPRICQTLSVAPAELGAYLNGVNIARYQFFVEREGVKIAVDLPPSQTQFQVPAEILALGDEFKFEIIARTTTGNNTAIESCFTLQ